MIINIRDNQNRVVKSITLPTTPEHLAPEKFLHLEQDHNDYIRWRVESFKDKTLDENQTQLEAILKMESIVSKFLDLKDGELYGMSAGDYGKFIEVLKKDDQKEIDTDSLEETITGVYTYLLVNVIKSTGKYPVENIYTFTHKGKTWKLPYLNKMIGAEEYYTNPSIKRWQMQYILETNRLCAKLIKENKASLVDAKHEKLATILAVLCYSDQDKEEVPTSKIGRKKYIERKKQMLQDVRAGIMLRADFFLSGIILS